MRWAGVKHTLSDLAKLMMLLNSLINRQTSRANWLFDTVAGKLMQHNT